MWAEGPLASSQYLSFVFAKGSLTDGLESPSIAIKTLLLLNATVETVACFGPRRAESPTRWDKFC
jgi:hypothetical protein